LKPYMASSASIALRAVFPLYPPIRLHSERHNELYYKFINEFEKPQKFSIRGSDFHDGEPLVVRALPCTRALQRKLLGRGRLQLTTRHILEFSGLFKFPGAKKSFFTDHEEKFDPQSEATLRSSWIDLLPTFLDVPVQTYLCALIHRVFRCRDPNGKRMVYRKAGA